MGHKAKALRSWDVFVFATEMRNLAVCGMKNFLPSSSLRWPCCCVGLVPLVFFQNVLPLSLFGYTLFHIHHDVLKGPGAAALCCFKGFGWKPESGRTLSSSVTSVLSAIFQEKKFFHAQWYHCSVWRCLINVGLHRNELGNVSQTNYPFPYC